MIIKSKLYNGDVEIIFDSFRHTYTNAATNELIKSVTTILKVIDKPGLIPWAANEAVNYASEMLKPGIAYDELQLAACWENARKAHFQKKVDAGHNGTIFHKWVERYIKGENPQMPVNESLHNSAVKFLAWIDKHKVEFICSEQPIYSKKYNYTGTLDFICQIDGKLYLGDLKTTSGIRVENYFQTAAYRHAREEEFPEEKYGGQLIVRISKEAELEFAINRSEKWYTTQFLGFLSSMRLSQIIDKMEGFKPERN